MYDTGAILLRVQDDGRGFDPNEEGFARLAHWGLTGMRERAKKIGGRFDITSRRGHGTQVEVMIQDPSHLAGAAINA